MADQYGEVETDSAKYVERNTKSRYDECVYTSPTEFDLPKYKITRNGRKLAIIINIMNFPNTPMPDRKCGILDGEVITNMLEGILGFEVFQKHNCRAKDLRELFIELSSWDYSFVDTVAIVLMSYGDNREIFSADGEKIEINELLDNLKGNNCPELAGKPKLVFINAGTWDEVAVDVTGEGYDEVDATNSASKENSNKDSQQKDICIPNEADFIYIYSPVTFGQQACGNIQQGNIFLTALSEMFLKIQATELELCDLLTQTNQQVALRVALATSVPPRPCFFLSTLTKELYFVANT